MANMFDQHGPQVTAQQFSALTELVQNQNFTEFYHQMYQMGSTISGLYIPGPTGYGIFGAYSHLISSDQSGQQFFVANQTLISTQIAEAVLVLISDSADGSGGYFLPTPHQVLSAEIEVFENIAGLGTEAYAGHDLIEALGIDCIVGAIEGGVGGSDLWDFTRLVISSTLNFILGEPDLIYQNSNIPNDDVVLENSIYFANHPAHGTIPVGITKLLTIELLNILDSEADVRENPTAYVNLIINSPDHFNLFKNVLHLHSGKFAEIMFSIFGTQEITFADGGIGKFTAGGTLEVVSESAVTTFYSRFSSDAECFPPGTLATLFDGTTKTIETLTPSDTVLSHNTNGIPVPGHVDKLFSNTTSQFIRLTFADGREDLVATPGHRFLTETGDYMEIGHMLRLSGGGMN